MGLYSRLNVCLAGALRLSVWMGFLFVPMAQAAPFSAQEVANGRYLAIAGDCTACHTSPGGGAPFAGGYAIASPLGAIYATNITPSKTDGIGSYTEAQFARALQQGVAADGRQLYPAMPYTAYTALSDADVHALYAYFMQGVAPVEYEPPHTELSFPFNLRFSMLFWNALFLHDQRFVPEPNHNGQWNRGAYLAGALEHCSTCHSPRGFLMQERTGIALSGGALGAWYAPNITSDPISGIGGWSRQDLVDYLHSGHVAGKAQAAGGMAEAVTHSLTYMSQPDLQALAVYISSVPAVPGHASKPAFTWSALPSTEATLRGVADKPEGATLYSGLCASCHGEAGIGTRDQVIPSLIHNSTVGAAQADNLVAVILNGVDRETDGNHVYMPAFGSNSFVQPLTDAQVASVATYVRATFGPGGVIVPADVATARAGGPPSSLLKVASFGIAAAVIVALGLLCGLLWMVSRRRRAIVS